MDEIDLSEIPTISRKDSPTGIIILMVFLVAVAVDLGLFWLVVTGHWTIEQILPYTLLFTLMEFQATICLWIYSAWIGMRTRRILKTWAEILELLGIVFFVFRPIFQGAKNMFRLWFPPKPTKPKSWWERLWDKEPVEIKPSVTPVGVQSQLDAMRNEMSMLRNMLASTLKQRMPSPQGGQAGGRQDVHGGQTKPKADEGRKSGVKGIDPRQQGSGAGVKR